MQMRARLEALIDEMLDGQIMLDEALEEFEKLYIQKALARNKEHLSRTAAKLGIHRNTLAYRLRRIGELIGRDVGDPRTWLTLHLALWASELLEVDVDER